MERYFNFSGADEAKQKPSVKDFEREMGIFLEYAESSIHMIATAISEKAMYPAIKGIDNLRIRWTHTINGLFKDSKDFQYLFGEVTAPLLEEIEKKDRQINELILTANKDIKVDFGDEPLLNEAGIEVLAQGNLIVPIPLDKLSLRDGSLDKYRSFHDPYSGIYISNSMKTLNNVNFFLNPIKSPGYHVFSFLKPQGKNAFQFEQDSTYGKRTIEEAMKHNDVKNPMSLIKVTGSENYMLKETVLPIVAERFLRAYHKI